MALYLGSSEEQKIILNGVVYRLNFFTSTPITNGVRMLLPSNQMLKDSNGLYITCKEG